MSVDVITKIRSLFRGKQVYLKDIRRIDVFLAGVDAAVNREICLGDINGEIVIVTLTAKKKEG